MVSKYYKRSAAGVVVDPDVPRWTELLTQWARDNAPKMINEQNELIQNRFAILAGLTPTVVNRWFLRGSLPQEHFIAQVHEATGIPLAQLNASANKTRALWQLRNSTGEILNNADHIIELAKQVERVEVSTEANTAAIEALTGQVEVLRSILEGGPALGKRRKLG
jgi:hypothetical protein